MSDQPDGEGDPVRKRKKKVVEPSPTVRQEWCIVLMLDSSKEGDAGYLEFLRRCKDTDSPVFSNCFQRDGSRHISLVKGLKLNAKEATQIHFPKPPQLPFSVKMGTFLPWRAGLYLGIASDSAKQIQNICSNICGMPRQHKVEKNFHMSLIRARGNDRADVNRCCEQMRSKCVGMATGWANAVRVALKVVGTEYGNDMKILA